MNHQAIEFLARDRIAGYTHEAESNRLARSGGPGQEAAESAALRSVGARVRAFASARAGALATSARALVSRAG